MGSRYHRRSLIIDVIRSADALVAQPCCVETAAMAASGTRSSHCASCGAPIASVEQERCAYCGTAIDTQAASAKAVARQTEAATKRAWRWSWAYVVIFGGISVLMALMAQRNVRKAVTQAESGDRPAPPGRPVEAAKRRAGDGLGVDSLLATLPQPGGTPSVLVTAGATPNVALYLLDARTGAVRWKNAPWTSSVGKGQVSVAGDKLFVVEESRLVALGLGNGDLLWQASLVADYAPHSEGFRVAGDRIAVLVRDGSTQGFDASTGRTVWTHKQAPPPGRLNGAGRYLLELRRGPSGRRQSEELAVVDVADGETRHRLRSRCSTHSVIPPDQPDTWSTMLFGGDGRELYLFYGTFRSCVERWDLATGAMAWQTNQAKQGQSVRRGHGETPFLMGERDVIFPGEDNAVYAMSRATGELRKLIADAENTLTPMFLQGGLLVVAATANWEGRTCGEAKHCSLWAVDLAKGSVRWRYALSPNPGGAGGRAADRLQGRFFPDGLSLAQLGGDQLVLDRVDLETGVSKVHRQLKLPWSMSRSPAYHDDLVWLWSGALLGIDPATGTIRHRLE